MSRRRGPLLTPHEERLLGALAAQWRETGLPPTLRELARTLDYASGSTVLHHLARLEAYGYVRRRPGQQRTLQLTPRGEAHVAALSERSLA